MGYSDTLHQQKQIAALEEIAKGIARQNTLLFAIFSQLDAAESVRLGFATTNDYLKHMNDVRKILTKEDL